MKLSALSALVLCSLVLVGCGSGAAEVIESESGLKTQVLVEGTGQVAVKDGSNVVVHYKGTLEDGTVFDSSYDRGQPLNVTVGAGRVIKGWDEGLVGMVEGETRRLTIPHQLGYGKAGRGPIPPEATLIFDIELLKIAGAPIQRAQPKDEEPAEDSE